VNEFENDSVDDNNVDIAKDDDNDDEEEDSNDNERETDSNCSSPASFASGTSSLGDLTNNGNEGNWKIDIINHTIIYFALLNVTSVIAISDLKKRIRDLTRIVKTLSNEITVGKACMKNTEKQIIEKKRRISDLKKDGATMKNHSC